MFQQQTDSAPVWMAFHIYSSSVNDYNVAETGDDMGDWNSPATRCSLLRVPFLLLALLHEM